MRNLLALCAIRVTLASAVALGLCLAGGASAKEAGRPQDFAKYLKEANLPALYAAELKRVCLEEADPAACEQFADGLLAEEKYGSVAALADTLKGLSKDLVSTAAMIRCRALYGAGRYADAAGGMDSLIAAMPQKDRLAEAVELRARCHYNLKRSAEALINLRALEPYIQGPGRAVYALWLARCEEVGGDLDRAVKLYEEGWKAGSAEAALGLARCHLRRGKPEAFLGVCKEGAKRGVTFPSGEACDLAVVLGDAAPELWHPLAKSVIADTLLEVATRPDLVASVVRMAEVGENVAPYCDALLGRLESQALTQSLRYARALSLALGLALNPARGATAADSLVALAAEAPDPLLKIRCLTAAIRLSPERGRELTRSLGLVVHQATGLVSPDDRLVLCRILIDGGAEDAASAELQAMLAGLKAGLDDEVMAEIGSLMESAGDTEAALKVYDLVAESPVVSESSLACEMRAYLARNLATPEVDIATEVEKIAKKGASDLELGDLFMEKLRDHERAAGYYAKVLEAAPKGVNEDAVRLKLARALALSSFSAPSAASPGGSADPRRSDAVGHLAAIAGSDAVKVEDIITAIKIATGWFESDQARTAEIAGALAQRRDITASSLYGVAGLLCGLVANGNLDYLERCVALLTRVGSDFPASKLAPAAMLQLSLIRSAAGDYAQARKGFEACLAKSRDPVLSGLCNAGIGECLLYSGGISDALPVLDQRTWWQMSYLSGRAYELLGRADSSLTSYTVLLAGLAPHRASKRSRLGLALASASSGRADLAFEALDSPLPATRDDLQDSRRLLAAHVLGKRGYQRFGAAILGRLAASPSSVACEAALGAARLIGPGSPEDASAMVRTAAAGDILQEYSLALDRARYACSGAAPRPCEDAAQKFRRRFPLDSRSSAELDLRRALTLEGEAGGDSATVDSLVAVAGAHPLRAELLYKKGIGLMVRGDYSGARQAFGTVVVDHWGSDLYRDACFKMGSTYYLMEKYDSSSIYFALAALGDKPALVRDALFNRGLALEEIGIFDLAADVYRTLAIRFPFSDQFERALIRRGYCLQSDGRPAEAVAVYKGLLRYADSGETQAETRYWIGESLAAMGDHAQASCEFLRVAFLHPSEQAWAGTAAFMAGVECEEAALPDHAVTIYRQNVRKFGKASDWGRASAERLTQLLSGGAPPEETPPGRGAQPGASGR